MFLYKSACFCTRLLTSAAERRERYKAVKTLLLASIAKLRTPYLYRSAQDYNATSHQIDVLTRAIWLHTCAVDDDIEGLDGCQPSGQKLLFPAQPASPLP